MWTTVITAIIVAAFTSIITGILTFLVQERKLCADLRTEFMSERAILELLESPQWQKRSFEEIKKRIGGFEDKVEPAILEIVESYISHHVMPNDPVGDALHLALASHYRCDFLVTWNCRHLANANKFDHIRRVNTLLGLYVPALVTPLEFLGEEYEK